MNLWYISLWLSQDSGFDYSFCNEFNFHTRFINHYLSIQVRKPQNRFKTDGTFSMLSIEPTILKDRKPWQIKAVDALCVRINFDVNRYKNIKGSADCTYYLDLLRQGFFVAAEVKEIPLNGLNHLLEEFSMSGCRNEWNHKKKRFKEIDVEVSLDCFFTTNYFKLVATISKISSKQILVSGTIISTRPDEVFFQKMFKDIVLEGTRLIVTDASDWPRVTIDLTSALKGKLRYKVHGDREVVKILSYSLE